MLMHTPLPPAPQIGEDIAKETAKEWKGLRVTVKLTVQNRQAKVSVIPSAAALVIKALKEPVRDRKKVRRGVFPRVLALSIARPLVPPSWWLLPAAAWSQRRWRLGQRRRSGAAHGCWLGSGASCRPAQEWLYCCVLGSWAVHAGASNGMEPLGSAAQRSALGRSWVLAAQPGMAVDARQSSAGCRQSWPRLPHSLVRFPRSNLTRTCLLILAVCPPQEKNIKHNGNLSLDDIYEIARVMADRSCAAAFSGTVKEMLGTCVSGEERGSALLPALKAFECVQACLPPATSSLCCRALAPLPVLDPALPPPLTVSLCSPLPPQLAALWSMRTHATSRRRLTTARLCGEHALPTALLPRPASARLCLSVAGPYFPPTIWSCG
jgi:ribosomal protein L11